MLLAKDMIFVTQRLSLATRIVFENCAASIHKGRYIVLAEMSNLIQEMNILSLNNMKKQNIKINIITLTKQGYVS